MSNRQERGFTLVELLVVIAIIAMLVTLMQLMISAIAAMGLGCHRSGELPTYEASGVVKLADGRVLDGGTVIFESVDHPVTARSVIDVDGSFSLGTYETGDGAVAGRHRVAVLPSMQTDYDRDERRAPPMIDPGYKDLDSSGLEFSVSEDAPNVFEIVLQPPKRRRR